MNEKEKNMLKFCLIGFLLIFLVLIFLENNYEIPEYEVSKVGIEQLNNYVKIVGVVKKQSLSEKGNLFVTVCDENNSSSCIKVILFDFGSKLEFGSRYVFDGKVSYFNSEVEILARSSRRIE